MSELEREKRRSDRVLDALGWILSFFLPPGPGSYSSSEEDRFFTVFILVLLLFVAVLAGMAWSAGYL